MKLFYNYSKSILLTLFLSLSFSQDVTFTLGEVANGNIEVFMNNSSDVAGFQFDVEGLELTGAAGGSAAANGFTTSSSSSTVLGFSFSGSVIPAGSGLLTVLSYDGTPSDDVCLTGAVVSGGANVSLDVSYGAGAECVQTSTISIALSLIHI